MGIIESGKIVLEKEIQSLINLKDTLGGTFESACQQITCNKGKIVFLGLGKSGHVAKKCAATFSSLGIPSFFVHAAEALHGDSGMISNQDCVIAFSYSGKTKEIIQIVDYCQHRCVSLIGISGNSESLLAKKSTIHLNIHVHEEADHLGLAPTASTTNMIALGDAIASAVSEQNGFTRTDFHFFHPDGNLGNQLENK